LFSLRVLFSGRAGVAAPGLTFLRHARGFALLADRAHWRYTLFLFFLTRPFIPKGS